jgi:hypothetical protein
MSAYSYNLEVDFIHPALAHVLAQRGGEWLYEYTFSNLRRVDFIEKLNGVTSLIECKAKLCPAPDIEQINAYHKIYGDPDALKVLAIPTSAYRGRVIQKYTDHNISIFLIDGDFSDSTVMPLMKRGAHCRVPILYPNNCDRRLGIEKKPVFENAYGYAPNRPLTTAERHGLSDEDVSHIRQWRAVGFRLTAIGRAYNLPDFIVQRLVRDITPTVLIDTPRVAKIKAERKPKARVSPAPQSQPQNHAEKPMTFAQRQLADELEIYRNLMNAAAANGYFREADILLATVRDLEIQLREAAQS